MPASGTSAAGVLVWFTGLPASGKSTLAENVRMRLAGQAIPVCLLDSDQVRGALLPGLGYDANARERLYAALASLAALLCEQGLVVLVAATAHRRAYRERARALVERFFEVHVTTPLEACEARDPKGLYARARRGEIADLPGIGVALEAPEAPAVTASGGHDEEAAERIVHAVEAHRAGRRGSSTQVSRLSDDSR